MNPKQSLSQDENPDLEFLNRESFLYLEMEELSILSKVWVKTALISIKNLFQSKESHLLNLLNKYVDVYTYSIY